MYIEEIQFICERSDEGESESIRVTFDSANSDIHDMFKRFGRFLISMSYAPESVQQGADEFDVEAI